ncbi:MAG: DEAD/DEAH box helicase family protein [Elusimicrobiales bacterium]|nr:DEAD/DEAH box helicase family protein [Elusimicrobiales bacterium]
MKNNPYLKTAGGSKAEDLFISLFADTFGAEKAGYLYSQYPFYDIYQNARYADFLIENGRRKVAIEIDDEATHNPDIVSSEKFADDLLKQNSMIYLGWDVYRWSVKQMLGNPDGFKDELRVFLGSDPKFHAIEGYLPLQKSRSFDGSKLELREYQKIALDSLEKLRKEKGSIALLYFATGTGKTVSAVLDAKKVGGRVLFVAHRKELLHQAAETFQKCWANASIGFFADGIKETNSQIVCAGVQSLALNLDLFKENDFDYIIIDEAHHAASESYQRVISYFSPKFMLGLTATPERTDGNDITEIFRNTAHRLDIKTAVETGALCPVRCMRIHTNIDMSNVRFNSVRYNIHDLDLKICVIERNRLIVDTWFNYVKGKKTVVFCTSVKHSEQVAELFHERGINAKAVSGRMKKTDRENTLRKFAAGEIPVLCSCDILNEGWDCPQTEVLFMARPTMSKVLYMQQLGRGMRLSEGKECLFVFDFVDNAGIFNQPLSLHRLVQIKDYRPGALVLAPSKVRDKDLNLYLNGEKPSVLLDWPVHATDYENVDIFNWQDSAAGMVSQMAFVRMVDVQEETVQHYIDIGKIVPDLEVRFSEHRVFRYFKHETVEKYAVSFGWRIIDDSNRKDIFMEMVERMDMSYSYKPVLLKALLEYAGDDGKVLISDVAAYFRKFYNKRRESGLIPEKSNSMFSKDNYTDSQAVRNILANPFRRFEDMNMMSHTRTLGILQVNRKLWDSLTDTDKEKIISICDKKLEEYYKRII